MTSNLPSGDGTETSAAPGSTLDEDAAPSTGLEPDTARDSAGQEKSSAAPDVSVASGAESDADQVSTGAGSGTGTADEVPETSPADDVLEKPDPQGEGTQPPSARTELDGPALENDEMRRATDDLRSSEDKSAQARDFAEQLSRQQSSLGSPPAGWAGSVKGQEQCGDARFRAVGRSRPISRSDAGRPALGHPVCARGSTPRGPVR